MIELIRLKLEGQATTILSAHDARSEGFGSLNLARAFLHRSKSWWNLGIFASPTRYVVETLNYE